MSILRNGHVAVSNLGVKGPSNSVNSSGEKEGVTLGLGTERGILCVLVIKDRDLGL